MGNCNHRRYIPQLLDLVRTGRVDPERVLTRRAPLTNAIEAYEAFDRRKPGWIKVELEPGPGARETRAEPVGAAAGSERGIF